MHHQIFEGVGGKSQKKRNRQNNLMGKNSCTPKKHNIQTNQTKNILARKIVLHDNFAQLPLPKASPLKYLVVHS